VSTRLRGTVVRESRRLDYGPQHVRAGAWSLAGLHGKDVRGGGGAATIRQYLRAGLLDEMHLAMSPILLGQGVSLFEGLELPRLGYGVKEQVSTGAAMHLVVVRH